MKNLFKYTCYLLIVGSVFSCSPQKRINRKQARVEKFARKHGLTIMDTIHIQDTLTVITEKVERDTMISFESFKSDTTIITRENLTIKTYYNSSTDSIYIFGECDTDTIYQPFEIKVPVEKVTVTESDSWSKYLNIIILVMIVGIILFRKKLK